MARTVTTGMLLMAVFCVADMGLSAERSTSYEHLKPLEWLNGNWVGEYVATADLGPVTKGDRVTVYGSGRWILNKMFMVADFQLEIGGKRTPDTHEIVGWDADRGQPVHWIFSPLGAGTGVWTEVGDRAVLRWSVDGKGGKLEGTSILEKVDENTHVWQAKKVTLDGKKRPDWPKVTMRRRQAKPAGDLWSSYRDEVAGAWLGTGTLNRDSVERRLSKGDAFTFRLTWKPDLGGKAMLGEGTFRIAAKDYSADVRSIVYWDPAKGHIRLTACWSNGDVEEITLQRKTRSGFLGWYVIKSAGRETERARIRFSLPDADSVEITFVGGPRRGQLLSSWKRVR